MRAFLALLAVLAALTLGLLVPWRRGAVATPAGPELARGDEPLAAPPPLREAPDGGSDELRSPAGGPAPPGRVAEATDPSRTVSGHVVDGETGAPLPGAAVRIGKFAAANSECPTPRPVDAGDAATRTTATDAEGAYRIEGLSAQDWLTMEVELEGYTSVVEPLSPFEGVSLPLDLELLHLRDCEFVVVDRVTGLPIPGALSSSPLAVADAQGRLHVRLAPTRSPTAELVLTLAFRAEGHATLFWACVVEDAGLTARIPLVPLAYAEGTLREADGRPVRSASTTLEVLVPAPEEDTAFEPTDDERARGVVGVGRYAAPRYPRPTGDGEFAIGILPTDARLRVRFDTGDGQALSTPFVLSRPGDRVRLDVVLYHLGRLRVEVTCNGEPWTGRLGWQAPGRAPGYGRSFEGDELFRNVEPGRVRVFAGPAEAPFTERWIQVAESRETRCELAFEAPELAGRVVDEEGNPVSGASIEVRSLERRFEEFFSSTSSDGAFLASPVPPGELLVTASHENRSARVGARAGDRSVEIVLGGRTGLLRLRFLDAASGEPVSPTNQSRPWPIWWRVSGEEVLRPHFYAGGSSQVRAEPTELHLPVGRVDLRVNFASRGYRPTWLTGVKVTDAEDPEPVLVRLVHGARLQVRWKATGPAPDGVGQPVAFLLPEELLATVAGPLPAADPRADVTLGAHGFALRDRSVLETCRALADGDVWDLPGLAAGRHHFLPADPRLVIEPAWIDVPEGGELEVDARFGWR